MRSIASLAFIFVCATSVSTPSGLLAQEAPKILNLSGSKNVSDPASYGIGYDIGMNIAANGFAVGDITQADLVAGVMHGLAGADPAVQPEAIREAMKALGEKVMARKKAESAKFLTENKKKEGVQVTQSGLQYQVIKSGNGAAPTADSTVTVHYEGKLTSGDIFDSSLRRGEPASFGVSQVIPGWTEALMRMKVGDKWKLFIPPDLAYGERGSPPVIGPNEPLIFEVELLEVK